MRNGWFFREIHVNPGVFVWVAGRAAKTNILYIG